MKLSLFSSYLQKLEATPKRLEIMAILSELIEKLSPEDVDKGIYLSLGYLKAQYENPKFNIADKMMMKAISSAYNQPIGEVTKIYEKLGDLGDTAFEVYKTKNFIGYELADVYKLLIELALIQGTGSQDLKINKLANLLKNIDQLSAKFIVRIILGTTRLGFTELTIIDALSNYLRADKSLKSLIESRYFIYPDIGYIAKILKGKNLTKLEKIEIKTGVPILAQKAQRLGGLEEILEKLKNCWAEYKFDGTRVQLHLDRSQKVEAYLTQSELFENPNQTPYLIKTFTRNLEDTTHQYPDIVQAANLQIKADSIILDGEALGIDKKTGEFLPFQQIMQRKRKHSVKEYSLEIPIKYFVFDILYLNGKSLANLPLTERHNIMKNCIKEGEVIKVTEHLESNKIDELSSYFEKAKRMNLEGLIIKKPNDPYQAGARSFSWIKLKKADEKLLADSMDLVVLGYYFGKGGRSDFGIGGFLVGVYDDQKDVFKTITKVGTGLKDEDWLYLKNEADKHKTSNIPKNVEISKPYIPDVILNPNIVVEIGADEISVSQTHTAGYALRFPRLLFFRSDRNPSQATTLKEIKRLYSLQKRGTMNSD